MKVPLVGEAEYNIAKWSRSDVTAARARNGNTTLPETLDRGSVDDGENVVEVQTLCSNHRWRTKEENAAESTIVVRGSTMSMMGSGFVNTATAGRYVASPIVIDWLFRLTCCLSHRVRPRCGKMKMTLSSKGRDRGERSR